MDKKLIKHCLNCNTEFQDNTKSKIKIYCSLRCRRKIENQRYRLKKKNLPKF